MKVTILQEELRAALDIAARFVARRSTLQILGAIHLAAEGDALQVQATNLEHGVTLRANARVEEAGGVAVPADTFAALVKTLPPEAVVLSVEASDADAAEFHSARYVLHLRCGATSARLNSFAPDDFPLLPRRDGLPGDLAGAQVEAATLKAAIEHCAFAAATDASRSILTGVLVRLDGETLTLVAADGFRLAVATAPVEAAAPVSLVAPASALREVARLVTNDAEWVRLIPIPDAGERATEKPAGDLFAASRALFCVEGGAGAEMVAQLVGGDFPAYQDIIPGATNTVAILYREDLVRALKRAEVFARESASTVRLHLAPGASDLTPGTVTVRATSAETGEGETVLTASITGPGLEIGFNVRYLLEALGAIATEQAALRLNGPGHAGVVAPVGRSDSTHVLMPMAIR